MLCIQVRARHQTNSSACCLRLQPHPYAHCAIMHSLNILNDHHHHQQQQPSHRQLKTTIRRCTRSHFIASQRKARAWLLSWLTSLSRFYRAHRYWSVGSSTIVYARASLILYVHEPIRSPSPYHDHDMPQSDTQTCAYYVSIVGRACASLSIDAARVRSIVECV